MRFESWKDESRKRRACERLFDNNYAQGAWDIDVIASIGKGGVLDRLDKSASGSGKCNGTFVYGGKCMYASSLNYIVYGKMCSLCNKAYASKPFVMQLPIIGMNYRVRWYLFDVEAAVIFQKKVLIGIIDRKFEGGYGEAAADAQNLAAIGYGERRPWYSMGVSLKGRTLCSCKIGEKKVKDPDFTVTWDNEKIQ